MERAEPHLRMMIERIPALARSCRPDGSIDFLNRQWIDYTGLSAAEALGWGWKIAVHPDDLEPLMEIFLMNTSNFTSSRREILIGGAFFGRSRKHAGNGYGCNRQLRMLHLPTMDKEDQP